MTTPKTMTADEAITELKKLLTHICNKSYAVHWYSVMTEEHTANQLRNYIATIAESEATEVQLSLSLEYYDAQSGTEQLQPMLDQFIENHCLVDLTLTVICQEAQGT